eukprot:4974393-Amphidinium_carterae.1
MLHFSGVAWGGYAGSAEHEEGGAQVALTAHTKRIGNADPCDPSPRAFAAKALLAVAMHGKN